MKRPSGGAGYMASGALARKARHEPLEPRTAWRDQRADRLGIGSAERVELLRVNRAGDEQQIESRIGGADGIGANAVADGKDARAVDDVAGGLFRQPEGLVV